MEFFKKTISFLIILSLLTVQTLWANETDGDLIKSRFAAIKKSEINELRAFLADPSVPSRQLEDILREMEGGLRPEQKECFKSWDETIYSSKGIAKEGEDEKNVAEKMRPIEQLLEDEDFAGILFLMAKAQNWKKMNKEFEFESPLLTYMLGALCVGQMMSIYFLVDALRKTFTKPFSFFDAEPPNDLSFFATLLIEPIIACALCLPVWIYNVVILGDDYLHQYKHSPMKPKAPQEFAKFLAHSILYGFCMMGCYLSLFVGEDLFRVMFVPVFPMAMTLPVYLKKIEFLARDAFSWCTSPSIRANVRKHLLEYVDDKLGKVESYADDLRRLHFANLRGLNKLHNWF